MIGFIYQPEKWSVTLTPELKADLSEWIDAGCDHEELEWRRRKISNGHIQISRQCLRCGQVKGGARKHSPDDIYLRETDPNLVVAYEADRSEEFYAVYKKHQLIQSSPTCTSAASTACSVSAERLRADRT